MMKLGFALIALFVGVAAYASLKSKGKKTPAGLVLAAAVLLSLGAVALSCVQTVPTGHTGVVTTFGQHGREVVLIYRDAQVRCLVPASFIHPFHWSVLSPRPPPVTITDALGLSHLLPSWPWGTCYRVKPQGRQRSPWATRMQ